MRALAVALAVALLLQGAALAQASGNVTVPADGYESTDTLTAGAPWRFYDVHVETGHELAYDFRVVGNGTISVRLYFEGFTEYSAYYSSDGYVSNFSRKVAADFGFARDYHIEVNSTSGADVTYTASIRMAEASTDNYNIYYALIVLGFIALVAGSWKFVVWQDRKEREQKKVRRKGRR